MSDAWDAESASLAAGERRRCEKCGDEHVIVVPHDAVAEYCCVAHYDAAGNMLPGCVTWGCPKCGEKTRHRALKARGGA